MPEGANDDWQSCFIEVSIDPIAVVLCKDLRDSLSLR